MTTLDNLNQIKKLDQQGMLESIEQLPLQCQQAWQEVNKLEIPKNYRKVKNILINGMGGSALGGHIIQAVFKGQLRVPIEVINSYTIPQYANQETLYIISSYSGNTEEPIGTIKEASKRKLKILGITSGGKLAAFLKQKKLPGYIFEPKFNPSGQPRMGLGYSILGQLALLKKCGLIKLKSQPFGSAQDKEISEVIEYLKSLDNKFGPKVKTSQNPAKQLAQNLDNKIPILVASQHLAGNAHILANQINENAKNFSAYFLIPELNHHLLEGLPLPLANKKVLEFLFLESKLYQPRNQLRYKVTKKVLPANKISFSNYQAQAKTPLLQVFETLSLGSYISFYLAILNRVNPSPIPWVDYFKKQMKR